MRNTEEIAQDLFKLLHDMRPFAAQYIADNELEDIGLGVVELMEKSHKVMKEWEDLEELRRFYDAVELFYTGYVPVLQRPSRLVEECSESPEKESIFTTYLSWVGAGMRDSEKPARP